MPTRMHTGLPNLTRLRVNNLVYWYAFFMSFPAIVLVQNISIYIFPFLLLALNDLAGRFIRIRNRIQVVAIIFGIGAIISTFNIPEELSDGGFQRAMLVLPNYLYWVVLILCLTSYAKYIQLQSVYKGIFAGVICSIIYYFVLQQTGITNFPVFKLLSQNAFAFLLICYSPIVIWYTWNRYGMGSALIALFTLTLCGFLSGSRSGSILVLSGGILTLVLNTKSVSTVLLIGVIGYLFIISLINLEPTKQFVKSLNPRTYEIIYNREETLDSDRSLLTRLAQIEKATLIYDKYPVSGIGLNNFGSYRIKLPGEFEGAEFVINKQGIDEKSAHNSYFGFLAEGGLVLIVPFVLILLYCITWFFRNLKSMRLDYKPIFIGIVHMSIHLYFIYAILNVFAWFLIGLGCMVVVRMKQ